MSNDLMILKGVGILFAIATSVGAVCISVYSSWIAREKLRLDLYNKRFEIYVKASAYALLHRLNLDNTSGISDPSVERNFIIAFRESKFLFKSDAQIYTLMKQILNICSYIKEYQKHPGTHHNPDKFLAAKDSIEDKLEQLEDAMMPYLKFDLVFSGLWQKITDCSLINKLCAPFKICCKNIVKIFHKQIGLCRK